MGFLKKNIPNEIIPGLFLGSWRAAVNRLRLQRMGIKYVLGVTLKA